MRLLLPLTFLAGAMLLTGCQSNKKMKHTMVEPREYASVNQELSCDNALRLAQEGSWVQAWQVANATISMSQPAAEAANLADGRGRTVLTSPTDCEPCYKVLHAYLSPVGHATEPFYSEYFKAPSVK